jgi:predicted enzyme related to lactoylglutathione lyase
MNNAVVHWEMMSKDPARVSSFYKKIFGWKIQNIPKLDYRRVETGAKGEMNGINGGILKPGGTICIEEQEVPGTGWLRLFIDAEGRMMGLWP